jgi:hypothetical protein
MPEVIEYHLVREMAYLSLVVAVLVEVDPIPTAVEGPD